MTSFAQHTIIRSLLVPIYLIASITRLRALGMDTELDPLRKSPKLVANLTTFLVPARGNETQKNLKVLKTKTADESNYQEA